MEVVFVILVGPARQQLSIEYCVGRVAHLVDIEAQGARHRAQPARLRLDAEPDGLELGIVGAIDAIGLLLDPIEKVFDVDRASIVMMQVAALGHHRHQQSEGREVGARTSDQTVIVLPGCLVVGLGRRPPRRRRCAEGKCRHDCVQQDGCDRLYVSILHFYI